MIARVLFIVMGLAGCSRGASEKREPAAAEPKEGRPAGGSPTATLELKKVDAGDALSKTVYARAIEDIRKDNPGADDDRILDDCLTTAAGVGAGIDYWDHEPISGKRVADWYLRSKDRAPLEAYLAAFPPANDHEWGYELREERCGRDRALRPMWRSYYLLRAAEVTGASVTEAKLHWNDIVGRHEVMVTFDAEGARRFADFTEKSAGDKMAILVDGTVTSAPVIMERISGGHMSILVGAGPQAQVEKDARAMADALDPR